MAIQSAIPVEFGAFFPAGAYMVGEVERVIEWSDDGQQVGQQHDKASGKPLWSPRHRRRPERQEGPGRGDRQGDLGDRAHRSP
ncbi:hypothetical protein [Humibacter ginsengisoli]